MLRKKAVLKTEKMFCFGSEVGGGGHGVNDRLYLGKIVHTPFIEGTGIDCLN
jgi:hypothetical protein